MAYFIDLFSPETYEAFLKSDMTISGFRERHRVKAASIKPGDKLVCYLTKLSRWFGILEVKSESFINNEPIFFPSDDPFIIRFQVKSLIWLNIENSIPIHEDIIWKKLSFTKNLSKKEYGWTGKIRGSLVRLDDSDGLLIENLLKSQQINPINFPIKEEERKKIITVKNQDVKQITVSIPENENLDGESVLPRESIKIQALLAKIGEKMNMRIWLPRNDRERVLNLWKPKEKCLLDGLPLNYDETTIRTIENIDVLWIKGRSIIRAFEVEHTTSIYSGILRMADLMALQPNLNIKAHIVAPIGRREKVFQEITRPVFSLLEKGPLYESCSFLSYDSITTLAKERNLEYMTDAVLESIAEFAEESDM